MFSNLYSKDVANLSLDSNLTCKDDSTFSIKIKIVDENNKPLYGALIYAVTLDNFDKKIALGESNEEGKFSTILSREKNYGYIYISYIGYEKFILSVKERKNLNVILKMQFSRHGIE